MSNEKTGEQPSWSSRLDELELPPDSDGSFRNRTWDELYVRLQEKQQQPRRIFWYWAAAVCLVLIGALSLPLMRHKKNVQHSEPVQPKELVETKTKPGTPVNTPPAGPEKPTSPTRLVPDRSPSTSRTETQPVLPEAPPAPAVEQVVLNGDRSGKTTDTINLAGVSLPDVRRKLKVVHVNELEEPGAAYEPTEGMAVRPWFRIHLPVNNPPVNLVGQEQLITSPGIGITRLFKISPKK